MRVRPVFHRRPLRGLRKTLWMNEEGAFWRCGAARFRKTLYRKYLNLV